MTLIVIHLLGGDVRERRGGLLRVEVGVRVNRRLSVHHKKRIPDHRLNARKFSKYFQKFFRAFDRLVNRPPVRNFFAVKTGDKQTIFDFLYRDFNFNFHTSSIAGRVGHSLSYPKDFCDFFSHVWHDGWHATCYARVVVSR